MGKNVLICGLKNMALTSLARRFYLEDWQVVTASEKKDVKHALDKLDIHLCIILLNDLKRKGAEFVTFIREHNTDICIVTINQSENMELVMECVERAGIDEFTLPFDTSGLIDFADKVVRAKCKDKGDKKMDKIKILLVDDEVDFVKNLSERMKMREIKSNIAYNGEQAIEMVDDQVPDVMILDIKMPGIDGIEVLRQIKENYPSVEVIILTGHGSDKEIETARQLGAFECLRKPVDIDHLISVILKAYKKEIA